MPRGRKRPQYKVQSERESIMGKLNTLLQEKNFKFNKKFGQNFISDKNLLNKIASLSGITKEDTVLEIGPGAGTLTETIAENSKRVVAYEIDKNLKEVLDESLKNADNVEIIFQDFLKATKDEIEAKVGSNYVVIANLPYYITSPIITRFLEGDFKFKALFFMMQKEVGDRIVSKKGTKDYGSISVLVQSYTKVEEVLTVNKNMFYPVPKVDSVIVKFEPYINKDIKNRELFNRVIRSAFKMRRKTLINNITTDFNISKEQAENILNKCNIGINSRGETLSLDEFCLLTNEIEKELG